MAKDPSPLLGYNNNIRHRNRVFHIQTEDSGVRHPHIITHLFMDGGRILKSVKTSYAEHVGTERMGDLVRKLMKDQHKGMLIALRDGQFNDDIDGRATPATSPASKPAFSGVPVPPTSKPDVAALPPEPSEPTPAAPSLIPGPPDTVHSPAPFFEAELDLPPPPANLFRPRTGGNYSNLGDTLPPVDPEPVLAPAGRPPTRPPPPARNAPTRPPPARPVTVAPGAPARRVLPPAGQPAGAPAGAARDRSGPPPVPPPRRSVATQVAVTSAKPPLARYASPRPAAIFGQSKPHGGTSIFGEDIISDKSLDEVIMSYLAEDLDASAARAGDRKPRNPEGPANAKATGTPEPGDAGSAATRRK